VLQFTSVSRMKRPCVALFGLVTSLIILSGPCPQASAEPAADELRAIDYPGKDASARINACIAAAIAQGGGECDARAFRGSQEMSQEIRLGNDVSMRRRLGLTLLLPDTAVWRWHLSDPSLCGIRQSSGTSLVGAQPGGGGNRMVLTAGSRSTMDAIYCTDDQTGGIYVRAEGFAVENYEAGNIFAHGVVHVRDVVDQSSFTRIFAENYWGDVWHVESACCGVTFLNIQGISNGAIENGGKGGVPLSIGKGKVHSISFYDSTFNEPGLGSPDIRIAGGGTYSVNFFNAFMEGNGAKDEKTPMVFIDQEVGPIHFFGGTANTEQKRLSNTKTVFENHGHELTLSYFDVVGTTLGIDDAAAGVKVPVSTWGSFCGSIPSYATNSHAPR
jgi:hypothetical protein